MAINGANFPEGKPHSFGQMIVREREAPSLMNQERGGPGPTSEIFRRPRIGSMPFFTEDL